MTKIAVFEDDTEVIEYLFNLYNQSDDDSPAQEYAVDKAEELLAEYNGQGLK